VMINVAQFCAERNLEVPPLFAYIWRTAMVLQLSEQAWKPCLQYYRPCGQWSTFVYYKESKPYCSIMWNIVVPIKINRKTFLIDNWRSKK
jgi:hypothetical protein